MRWDAISTEAQATLWELTAEEYEEDVRVPTIYDHIVGTKMADRIATPEIQMEVSRRLLPAFQQFTRDLEHAVAEMKAMVEKEGIEI